MTADMPFERAQVVLVGTGAYLPGSRLPDVPAIAPTLADLSRALVQRCGLRHDRVRMVLDPRSLVEMGEAVTVATEAATPGGPLLFYYAGHGLLSQRGELYLSAAGTDGRPNRLEHTALSYAAVRRRLLDCAARPLIVILDCCFSGRALEALTGGEDEIADLAAVDGAFVLTSAGRHEMAIAEPGARHTAFTGALLRLLSEGDPDGPAWLTLQDAYRYLASTLVQAGMPRPRQRTSGGTGDLRLVRNLAYRPIAVRSADQPTIAAESSASGECPYKGLAAYEAADSRWFYGRDRLVSTVAARLAERFDDPRPLVVTGVSGCGKSSLLRAGLIPAIGHGALEIAGSTTWPRLLLTPTSDPLERLAQQIATIIDTPAAELAALLRTDPSSLFAPAAGGRGSAAAARPGAQAVIVVDQFEEVFTECGDEDARRAFIAALCAAANGSGELAALVVIGVRADFYGRCAEYPELTRALEGQQVIIGPMTATELRAAIDGPARAAGLVLEAGLIDVILTDVGVHHPIDRVVDAADERRGQTAAYEPGRLPLLSHALLVTWQQRESATLTTAGYRRGGGIHGALAATADRVLAELDEDLRPTARSVLLHLVRVGDGTDDTRRRVDRAALMAELPSPERVTAVIEAFARDDVRLVTVEGDTVVLTHEALLRAWPVLRAWIDTDRAQLVMEQHLLDAAHGWDRTGREAGALYRGGRLGLAREWSADPAHHGRLGPLPREFLDASLAAERRTRRRWAAVTTVLVALLAIALVAAGLAVDRSRDAATQRTTAVAQSMKFRAQTIRDRDPALALRLAVAAYAIAPGPDTEAVLTTLIAGNRHLSELSDPRQGASVAAYSPDGRIALTGGYDSSFMLWNVTDAGQPRRLTQLPDSGGVVYAFSPTTPILLTGSGGMLIGWDIRDPAAPRRLAVFGDNQGIPAWEISVDGDPSNDEDQINAVAYGADGHTVLTGGVRGRVTVWDLSEPQRPRRRAVTERGKRIISIVLWPDSRTAAIAELDGSTTLWSLANPGDPIPLATLTGPQDLTTSLSLNAAGDRLMTGGPRSVAVWDVDDPTSPRQLTALPTAGYTTAALDDTGNRAVTGGLDGAVTVWNLTPPTGPRPAFVLRGHADMARSAAFRPDQHQILTGGGDGNAFLWDATDHLPPRGRLDGADQYVTDARLAPDGRTAVTIARNSNVADPVTIKAWTIPDRGTPHTGPDLNLNQPPHRAVTGPDGLLVTLGDHTILWDISVPTASKQVATIDANASSVHFSTDARRLYTRTGDTITIWEIPRRPTADTGQPPTLGRLGSFPLPNDFTGTLAFIGNGRTALISPARTDGRYGGTLWDISDPDNPTQRGQLAAHTYAVSAITSSQDGRTVITGSHDGTAILWNVTNPDAPLQLPTLHGHSGGVSALQISQDGRMLAIGADDGSLTLWQIIDPSQPTRLLTIPAHDAEIASVSLDTAGHSALTGSSDGTAALWNLDRMTRTVTAPHHHACSIIRHGLNQREWQLYASGTPFRETCPP
jgi:WD40 repeat protein